MTSSQLLDSLNYELTIFNTNNEVYYNKAIVQLLSVVKGINDTIIALEFHGATYSEAISNDLNLNVSVNVSNDCGSDVSDNIIIDSES